MTSQPAPPAERSLPTMPLAVVLALAAAVAALSSWATAVSQVLVDLRPEVVPGVQFVRPAYCGEALSVWFNGPDIFRWPEYTRAAEAEYRQACSAVSSQRLLLALGFLVLAIGLATWALLRHRRDPGTVSLGRLLTQAPVGRVGAMIGLFYFLGAITLAALFGYDAWWVNYKEVSPALGYFGVLAGALLLILLPRYPQATFLACGGLAFAMYGLGVMLGLPTVLMALIALFGVTLWTNRRTGLLALSASLGSLAIAVVMLFVRYGFDLPPLETFLTDRVALFLFNSSGVVVLTWAVADQIRAARERKAIQAESAAHAAEAVAHQQVALTTRGQMEALADRQRIAREMHDVVAHGLSVMIVQADGARFAAASDPDAATTALATIAATGRASLAEMRRLLSVLRDESEAAPDAPQPGLADVPALVQRLVDGGRKVALEVDGDLTPGGANDATGLTAYRIVQEALTNVMKHAGDEARAWVRLTTEPSRVVVEVVDDGAAGPAAASAQTDGHGLRGMHERVDMLGGSLVAGPDPRGGWRVVASLPRRQDEPFAVGETVEP